MSVLQIVFFSELSWPGFRSSGCQFLASKRGEDLDTSQHISTHNVPLMYPLGTPYVPLVMQDPSSNNMTADRSEYGC